MKAHDVRHLRVCPGSCANLVDDRAGININGVCWCGSCAFAFLGLGGIKKLPRDERRKFQLGQIGAVAMRELMKVESK